LHMIGTIQTMNAIYVQLVLLNVFVLAL
jgi:hypothetical protein